jgi:preprotein translocase subunit YajC
MKPTTTAIRASSTTVSSLSTRGLSATTSTKDFHLNSSTSELTTNDLDLLFLKHLFQWKLKIVNLICLSMFHKTNKIKHLIVDSSSNVDQFSSTTIGFIVGGFLLMILIVGGLVFVLIRRTRRRKRTVVVDHQNNLQSNDVNLKSGFISRLIGLKILPINISCVVSSNYDLVPEAPSSLQYGETSFARTNI